MFDFFPFLLVRLMAEVAYDAETADLSYSFDADCFGYIFQIYLFSFFSLKIQVSGLNDKLHLLYQEILNQIANFSPSQAEFDSLKVQFLDNYSTYMKMASNYGKELRLWLMENTRNDALDRKNAFRTRFGRLKFVLKIMTWYEYFPILYSEVTRQEMIDFVAEFRKTAWCQMHIEGNFYQKEAEKLFDLSMKKLKSKLTQYFQENFSTEVVTWVLPTPCTVRFKNFRDDEFQKPRKFLTNIESFQTGVENVEVIFVESFRLSPELAPSHTDMFLAWDTLH